MEKIAFIPQFEVPKVFMYPLSRLGAEFGIPAFIYALIMAPRSFQGTQGVFIFFWVLLIHLGLLSLLFLFINSKFPIMISFEVGGITFERILGKKTHVPYENIHAILESPLMTVFATKQRQKFFFLPIQTDREMEFGQVLMAIQHTLQTRNKK